MIKTDESIIERAFIEKLEELKYVYRQDIRDRHSMEQNYREKFEALNHVKLTDQEFSRLLDQIITPNVYEAAERLRTINSFERDDGTQLNYTLVNIKDWCKNTFERSEEHTSELQSRGHLVCRLLLEKKKNRIKRRSSGNIRILRQQEIN